MKVKYAWSACKWLANANYHDQLDLTMQGVRLAETMKDVWRDADARVVSWVEMDLVIIIDLLAKDGPEVECVYGFIPGKYVDRSHCIDRDIDAVKNKIVSYVIQASLSEALKPE